MVLIKNLQLIWSNMTEQYEKYSLGENGKIERPGN